MSTLEYIFGWVHMLITLGNYVYLVLVETVK